MRSSANKDNPEDIQCQIDQTREIFLHDLQNLEERTKRVAIDAKENLKEGLQSVCTSADPRVYVRHHPWRSLLYSILGGVVLSRVTASKASKDEVFENTSSRAPNAVRISAASRLVNNIHFGLKVLRWMSRA